VLAAAAAVRREGAGVPLATIAADAGVGVGMLYLHGGPLPLDQDTIDLRAEVDDTTQHVLHRGRQDGSIRPDVTALDIIVFGALLAQPLPHVPDWKLTARRPAAIHFDGLAGATATATEQ
jgi:hypothetical protein